MKKIKTILVDDEQSARDLLSGLLKKFCPDVELISTCEDVETAVEAIKIHQPDLVFLDIEMPNYAGYELVNFFETIDFEIIFITAYDQYAIKAFEISAIDYLLKPVAIDRLKQAIERTLQKKELKALQTSYEVLKENLSRDTLTKIIIPHNGVQKVIQLTDIIAFEAKEAYTLIHTLNGSKYIVSKNLKYFETLLEENNAFFRIHKSWLIHLSYVSSYSKSNLSVSLNESIDCKLSKYRKAEFEERFLNKS